MSRKQATLLVAVALFAGFLGGVVSQQVGLTVLAQTGPAEKIEAREFRLVDANGRLLGLIKAAPTTLPAEVWVRGKDGQPGEIQSLSAQGGAIMLFDSQGQATWAAPDSIEPPARFRPLTEAK
jgi:hypothetical protein